MYYILSFVSLEFYSKYCHKRSFLKLSEPDAKLRLQHKMHQIKFLATNIKADGGLISKSGGFSKTIN